MNKTTVGLIIGVVLGAAGTWLALSKHSDAAPAPAEAAAKPAENPLHLPPAKREAAGIKLAPPVEQTITPAVVAYGRVLDATPLAALVAELQTSRAALAATEKELDRAKKLFAAGGNASAQAVETAEANAARDRAAAASVRTRLAATWGRAIAGRLDEIAAAVEHGASLARIDLLSGDKTVTPSGPVTCTLVGNEDSIRGELLGVSPTADPQVQGMSFLVLLPDHPLPAGAALRATLPAAGEPVKALVVPPSAVVYHQGSAWVYVLGEEDTFERKIVTPGRGADSGVTISSGLEPGEQVVIAGAQQLLSAELQAGGSTPED